MMEIRFLTADDAAEWWRLRLESLERDPEAFSASAEDHQSLKLEDVRSRLGSGGDNFFVAGAIGRPCQKKSALDFSVQDASAALPQNCQTTSG
jgi:hypothetical protein